MRSLRGTLSSFCNLYQTGIKAHRILGVMGPPMAVRAQRNHVLGVVRPTIGHTVKMVALKIRTL